MTWTKVRLGELCRIKHGYAFKSEYFGTDGPYVLLTPGSFHEEGGYRDQGEKTKFYVGDVPDGYVLDEGDVIVAMTEQAPGLLGSSAWIPRSGTFLHNQRLGRVVDIDASRISKSFLYFLFNTTSVRQQISATATGGKVRHTAPDRISDVAVRIPEIDVQERIAEMLWRYDDLIDNNCRRMTLIEEAARQLYREWFVRLRFPGHEHTKMVDRIPQGWQPMSLGDICRDVRDSVRPEQLEPDTPYIGLEHMPRRSISLAEWGKAKEITSTKLRFRRGEILFGKIRPYFHKVGIALVDGVVSSDAIVIRPASDELRNLVLMTVSSDHFVAATAQGMKEGSKMPRADWKQMKQFRVPVPPATILSAFDGFVRATTDQLRTLTFQNRNLRAARDLLLPRLMRGELTV